MMAPYVFGLRNVLWSYSGGGLSLGCCAFVVSRIGDALAHGKYTSNSKRFLLSKPTSSYTSEHSSLTALVTVTVVFADSISDGFKAGNSDAVTLPREILHV